MSVLNITSRSVTLKWSRAFNGNSPIKWYRLVYEQDAGGEVFVSTKEEIVDGDKNHTHLQNLQPVTSYRLSLMAHNEIGSSGDSEVITITTLEEGK